MLKLFGILLGILLIFLGVSGFFPGFSQNGFLFGFFEISLLHNLFHIITGVLLIMAATSNKATKLYLICFGLIYTLIAIVGFWRGGDLYIVHNNLADNILYLGIGVIASYVGFSAKNVID